MAKYQCSAFAMDAGSGAVALSGHHISRLGQRSRLWPAKLTQKPCRGATKRHGEYPLIQTICQGGLLPRYSARERPAELRSPRARHHTAAGNRRSFPVALNQPIRQIFYACENPLDDRNQADRKSRSPIGGDGARILNDTAGLAAFQEKKHPIENRKSKKPLRVVNAPPVAAFEGNSAFAAICTQSRVQIALRAIGPDFSFQISISTMQDGDRDRRGHDLRETVAGNACGQGGGGLARGPRLTLRRRSEMIEFERDLRNIARAGRVSRAAGIEWIERGANRFFAAAAPLPWRAGEVGGVD